MSRLRRNLIATLVAALVCVAVPLAQRNAPPVPPRPAPAPTSASDTPTFRVSVRYIEVDLVVEDKHGKFVPGLTKDDFVLTEDLRPQTIDKVTLVDLPEPLPGDGEGEPFGDRPATGPAENSPLTSFEQSGRIYVLVLDSGPADSVTRLARRFIESYLAPADLMAVVHVSQAKGQPLTGNKELLIAATERYRPHFQTDEASFKTLKDARSTDRDPRGRRERTHRQVRYAAAVERPGPRSRRLTDGVSQERAARSGLRAPPGEAADRRAGHRERGKAGRRPLKMGSGVIC